MKKAIMFTMTGFLILGVALTVTRRNIPVTDAADLKAYYGDVIDKVITECRERSRLKSGRIERTAVFNCFKKTYFELRRSGLIVELMDKNIGKNAFLIRYHLNRSFYKTIREPASI